jgi:hypothetical protein
MTTHKSTQPDLNVSAEPAIGAEQLSPTAEIKDSNQACLTAPVPIRTLFIPAPRIELERDVRQRYLSNALEEICEVAAISGSAVLIASAGLSLGDRQIAFEIWRKTFLNKLRILSPDLNALMNENSEVCEGLESGTLSFVEVDGIIEDRKRQALEAASLLRQAKKQALKDSLRMNTIAAYEGNKNYPTHCVVRGDGEMKLFYSHSDAKAWGQASQVGGFHLLPFEQKLLRTFMIP